MGAHAHACACTGARTRESGSSGVLGIGVLGRKINEKKACTLNLILLFFSNRKHKCDRKHTHTHNQHIMKTTNELAAKIAATPARSGWRKGVKAYALELLESATENGKALRLVDLLNGAENWRAFSYGGNALIYDYDICARLCSPSERKKTREGERQPNKSETWLDCQARALSQAATLISTLSRK